MSPQGVPSGWTPASMHVPLPLHVSWFVQSVPASPQGEPAPANWQLAVQHAPPSQASPASTVPLPHTGTMVVLVVEVEEVEVLVDIDVDVLELVEVDVLEVDVLELVELDVEVVDGGGAEMVAHKQAELSWPSPVTKEVDDEPDCDR